MFEKSEIEIYNLDLDDIIVTSNKDFTEEDGEIGLNYFNR